MGFIFITGLSESIVLNIFGVRSMKQPKDSNILVTHIHTQTQETFTQPLTPIVVISQSSLSVKFCFLHILQSMASSCSIYVPDGLSTICFLFLWSTSAWHPPLHTPNISSPNHCLLFMAHAHTIATCFAVVPRLLSNPSLSLNILVNN